MGPTDETKIIYKNRGKKNQKIPTDFYPFKHSIALSNTT